MQFMLKLLAAVCIIIICSQIGRKVPTLSGLIATMPLTALVVMIWLNAENKNDFNLMTKYAKGAAWGVIPSLFFFGAAFFCFKKELPLAAVLCVSFGVWLLGALVHQFFLR